jgi:hypothetical protein
MATCTITIAATTTTTGATDAIFNDPSVVERLTEIVANYVAMGGTPTVGGATITANLNNNAYSIVYTVVNT